MKLAFIALLSLKLSVGSYIPVCGGDLSGTYPTCTVSKVNGLAVPLSAGLTGTNASRQFTTVTTPLAVVNGGTGTPNGATTTLGLGALVGAIGSLGTDYYSVGFPTLSATVAQRVWTMPVACTVQNLTIATTNAQPGTGSLVFNLIDSGTDPTAIGTSTVANTVTIAASAGAGIYSDSTNHYAIAALHMMTLQVINNASSMSANFFAWGFQCL